MEAVYVVLVLTEVLTANGAKMRAIRDWETDFYPVLVVGELLKCALSMTRPNNTSCPRLD